MMTTSIYVANMSQPTPKPNTSFWRYIKLFFAFLPLIVALAWIFFRTPLPQTSFGAMAVYFLPFLFSSISSAALIAWQAGKNPQPLAKEKETEKAAGKTSSATTEDELSVASLDKQIAILAGIALAINIWWVAVAIIIWFIGQDAEGHKILRALFEVFCPVATLFAAFSFMGLAWSGTCIRCDVLKALKERQKEAGDVEKCGDSDELVQDEWTGGACNRV
jgi:hypothetical protein